MEQRDYGYPHNAKDVSELVVNGDQYVGINSVTDQVNSPTSFENTMLMDSVYQGMDMFPAQTKNCPMQGSAGSKMESAHSPTFRTESKISKSSDKVSTPTGLSEVELYQRRKAQNRAAQRAFRERKESKLKELSNKLKQAEMEREKLERQLAELKQKNKILDIENQILQKQKAVDSSNTSSNSEYRHDRIVFKNEDGTKNINWSPSTIGNNIDAIDKVISYTFPSTNKRDFIDNTIDWSKHGTNNRSNTESEKLGQSYSVNDEKVLTISAVWDYLVEFSKLNPSLNLDMANIMKDLRGKEVCHGYGPAYPIGLINEIIERNVELD